MTPVEKVVALIKNLRVKIEAEGKTEAAAYDKRACFCKEQADKKVHAIQESAKLIKYCTLRIEDIKATIPEYSAQVAELAKNTTIFEQEMKDEREKRSQGLQKYVKAEQDFADAISGCKDAIAALKDSKNEMTEANLDLAQVKAITGSVLIRISNTTVLNEKGEVAALVKLTQQPAKYEYHSNDILAILQGLKKSLIDEKQQLDLTELGNRENFLKKDTNLKNLVKFTGKDKKKREEQLAKLEEDQHDLNLKKDIETRDMNADQAFLDELSASCEEKATLWDQRSTTRTSEITALTQALEVLSTKVAPTYSANKEITNIQVRSHAATLLKAKSSKNETWTGAAQSNSSSSRIARPAVLKINTSRDLPKGNILAKHALTLLQTTRSHSAANAETTKHVMKVADNLAQRAVSLKSQLLSVVVTKMLAAKDHFVKVRTIIKDLIDRLQVEAGDEVTAKSFCDESMARAMDSRDRAQADAESLTAVDNKLRAEEASLKDEVADLSAGIADLKKGLTEASELRVEERRANEQTLADTQAGKAGIEVALNILNSFYQGAELVQQAPSGADRDGNTIKDLAPGSAFHHEYKGQKEASKGIIGMLEVILSDFDRTAETVTQDEKNAEQSFIRFESGTNDDISAKAKSKDDKMDRITVIDDELVETANSLREHNALFGSAKDTLAELKKNCVGAQESYSQRVASREKEVAALKEAQKALENWQD